MRGPLFPLAALCTAGALLAQDVRPVANITRVESLPQNKVRVSLSIQDQNGKPLADLNDVRLTIFENGKEVAAEQLSSGWSVSSVLVIDLSGSMFGPNLEGAKQAALHYVDQAPANVEVALIGFASEISVRHPFSSDKDLLRKRILDLAVTRRARTALNDAVWGAVETLQGRTGRRAVLALTDGIDNASRRNQLSVVEYARNSEVTVSAIGLGSDVRPEALKGFTATGGRYLTAAQASELRALFGQEAQFLKAEYQVEFTSLLPADGSRRQITANVELRHPEGTTTSGGAEGHYVAPRFIPAVRGSILPYSLILAILLVIPGSLTTASAVVAVRKVRSLNVSKLAADSKLIGALDTSGIRFSAGHPIIFCPEPRCRKPHHVRSWRLQRCRCSNDNTSAPLCYQRILPVWVRRTVARLTGGRSSAMGRMWLCRCAGDPEGY
jgi:VWFA-related protein